MEKLEIKDFLKKHNINFKKLELYERAITHTTFSNENKSAESYELLELLGDSIIQAKSTIFIFNNFHDNKDIEVGEMTQIRSKNVDNNALALISKELGLNKYLRCSNNCDELMQKTKICADLFEALIGAIYLDLGDRAVEVFLNKYLIPKIKKTDINNLKDYKTQFQELIQSTSSSEISYKSIKQSNNTFETKLIHNGQCYGVGVGPTKKKAENLAAKNALDKMPKI